MGKENFLKPYTEGVSAFQSELETLRGVVSDNPSQVALLVEIKALVDKWHQEAARPEIALRREMERGDVTLTHVQDLLAKGIGKAILDELRTEFDRLIKLINTPSSSLPLIEKLTAELHIYAMAKAMVDQETGQRGFLITGQENFLEPYTSGQQNFTFEYLKLTELLEGIEPAERILVRLNILANQWQRQAALPEIKARRQVNEAGTSFRDIQILIEAETGKSIMDNLRSLMNKFITVEKTLISDRLFEAELNTKRAVTITIWGISLIILVAGGAIIWVSRSMTVPLNVLANAMKAAARRGDFSGRVPTGSGTFETNQLGEIFNSIAANAEDEVWLKSKAIDILAGVSQAETPADYCANLITVLGSILNSAYGSIFLLDEANGNYDLAGTFRLKLPLGFQRSFAPGEGLIGQCAQTNTTHGQE